MTFSLVFLFVSFLFFLLLFFFFGCTATYGILVPEPEIEPMPPAMEAQSLNHWKSQCDLLSGMKNTSSTLPLIHWEI